MEHKTSEDYDKIIEIELKKKALKEEHGMQFSVCANGITPELENSWLDYITNFEKQYKNAEHVSVYLFIGEPEYIRVEDLDPLYLKQELESIQAILSKNNIVLNTLCEVSDEEMYRFITEELFLQKIDNMRVEGMMSFFTYEDFHPNAMYDIEHAIDHFFTTTFNKSKTFDGENYDMLYVDLDSFIDIDSKPLVRKQVEKKITSFLDAFDRFNIIEFSVNNTKINSENTVAEVFFSIFYKGVYDNSSDVFEYRGKGTFKLKPSQYGGWDIFYINMPGLKF